MVDIMRTRESATDEHIQYYNDNYEWLSIDINYPETSLMRQYPKGDLIFYLSEEDQKKRIISDLKADLFRFGL